MLDIQNIDVKIKAGDKEILKDFSLSIGEGEVHAIMGPNGTGKSTLAKVIMGHYKYEVTAGSISFDSRDITDCSVDERARMGIFLGMQDPTEIEGVRNSEFLRVALKEVTGENVNLYKDNPYIKRYLSSNKIISKYVDLGKLKENNPKFLDIIKSGWIGIDDYALLVDLPSDGTSRGYVTLNKLEIKKAKKCFTELQKMAILLKDIMN